MIIYVILKNGGNENSPYYLNVMVNYHYCDESRVITRQFLSMTPMNSHMRPDNIFKSRPYAMHTEAGPGIIAPTRLERRGLYCPG